MLLGLPINLVLLVEHVEPGPNSPFELEIHGKVASPPDLVGKTVRLELRYSQGLFIEQKLADLELLGDAARWEEQRDRLKAVETGFTAVAPRPGSFSLFYACRHIPDDEGLARYTCHHMELFGPRPDRRVLHGLCRVIKKGEPIDHRLVEQLAMINEEDANAIRREIARTHKAHVDILWPDKAVLVKKQQDLRSFFDTYMAPMVDGIENNANCLLRVVALQTGEVILAWTFVAREMVRISGKGGREKIFSVPGSCEKTWDDAIFFGNQSEGLPRVIAAALGIEVDPMSAAHEKLAGDIALDLKNGNILIEAIPGQRIRVIGDSLIRLFEDGSKMQYAASRCVVHGEDGTSSLRFIPMTACLLISKPAGFGNVGMTAVIAKLVPDVTYKHYSNRDISTANFAGKGTEAELDFDEYLM